MSLAGAGQSPQTLAAGNPRRKATLNPQKQAERLAPCRRQSRRQANPNSIKQTEWLALYRREAVIHRQAPPNHSGSRDTVPCGCRAEPADPCRRQSRRQANPNPIKPAEWLALYRRKAVICRQAPPNYTIPTDNPGRRLTDIKKRRHLCSLLHKSRRLMSNPEFRRRDFHCVDFDRSLFCGTGLLPYFH